ncbi:MAG: hypothetical protein KGY76_01660 [Candidatus Thermoplasmatota archaeon]|nr:hypothetical protein [Candidatus Thermoplasmatota archaeon]
MKIKNMRAGEQRAKHMLRTIHEMAFRRDIVPVLDCLMFASDFSLSIGLDIATLVRSVGGEYN